MYYNDYVTIVDMESLVGANTKIDIHDIIYLITVIN